MKVVLDTNVLVSGMLWKGNPEKIIHAWKAGKFELITSLATLAELQRVLRYPRIGMSEKMIKEWADLLLENSTVVDPKIKVDVIKNDPPDNRFLEAALAGNADYIVSGNNHLLDLHELKGIKIILPVNFCRLL